jgi:hypothetical protein
MKSDANGLRYDFDARDSTFAGQPLLSDATQAQHGDSLWQVISLSYEQRVLEPVMPAEYRSPQLGGHRMWTSEIQQ